MTRSAPLPHDETQRLALLRAFDILDSEPEDLFDDLTRLAAQICGTPLAMVSLVDAQRQWYKSVVGGAARDMPRADSFCAHAITAPTNLMEVRDLRADLRFAGHPLVTGPAQARFYAGMPLDTGGASAIGTLCVIDTVPRSLSAEQRQALTTLARAVVSQLELRRSLVRHDSFYVLLSRMTALVSRARTLESLCLETCRLASQFLGIEIAAISRVDEASGELQLLLSVESDGSERDWTNADVTEAAWHDPALVASVLASGAIAYSNDHEPQRENRRSASYLAVPLLANGKKWGVICFHSPRPHCFDAFYRERAAEIGNEISFGLERLIAARELHRLSHTNALTGLPSRLHFEERIAAFAQAQLRGTAVLLNVDRLDEINSAYGNAASSALLQQVAGRLRAAMPRHMLLSYIGTGRFALFLGAEDDIDARAFVRDTVSPLLQGAYLAAGQHVWCSIHAGGACLPEDGNSADALLVKAWEALSSARERGDGFALYDRDADQALARQLSLESELRDAIERGEFVNYYQPKIDLKSGRMTGAEALIRWKHPLRGIVAPFEFIPVLERSGLIIQAGRQVLERAMIDWRCWYDEGLMPPQIAVNVAPAQFKCDSLIADIERVLDIAEPHMQPLSIEITEGSLVQDPARVGAILQRIRSLDVPVAIDDFGTGYSSLAYLVTLPVDILKIDRSFVMQMTSDAGYMGLVSTIVSLAHNLDLKVVAEGIETEEEAKFLRLLRCEQGQGYLYSRPVPADDFAALLRKQ